jgi:hypothetical protein
MTGKEMGAMVVKKSPNDSKHCHLSFFRHEMPQSSRRGCVLNPRSFRPLHINMQE